MQSYFTLLLTISVGVIGANSLALSPIAGEVAEAFPHAAASDVMRATASYGGATALSALLLAPLADRLGAARCLAGALALLTLAFAATAASPRLELLLIAQAAAGTGAGVALPACYGLAAQIAPAGQEGRTMGRVLTGWTLSLVFGVTISAALTDYTHWRVVFTTLAAISFGLTFLVGRSRFPQSTIGRTTSPLTALRVPGIGRALFSVAALMLSFYGPYTYLGGHLTGTLNVSTTAAAGPVLAYGIGFGLATRVDPLIDRWGYASVAPVTFALVAAVLAALAVGAGLYPAIVAAAFAWGLVNHVALNLAVGRLAGLDASQRGAIMGLNSATTYVAAAVAALAFKPVVEAAGLQAGAALAAICVALAAVEALAGRRRSRKPVSYEGG